MNIPNTSIARFYEGTNQALYSNLTGTELNKAPDQLLANDVALQSALTSIETTMASPAGVPLSANSTKVAGYNVVVLTQAAYDALGTKNASTLYFVQ
jgi:hypothetical protein